MPTRPLRRLLLGLVICFAAATSSLSLIGCQYFFGNDKQTTDPLVFKEQGLSCVRSVGNDVSAFFSGKDQDPVLIVDCLLSALMKFSETTRGASADGWTRGELASFFETYFKTEAERDTLNKSRLDISWTAVAKRRAVVGEVFKWKSILIGGGSETLARTEILRVQNLLHKIREPLSKWRGHGARLGFHQTDLDNREIDSTTDKILSTSIREVAGVLTSEMVAAPSSLGISREPVTMTGLIESFRRAGLNSFAELERQALLRVVKSLIVGGDDNVLAGSEWPVLFEQAAELWIVGLRTVYSHDDLEVLGRLIEDVPKILEKVVSRHSGRVEPGLLVDLFKQLEVNKLLPFGIRAKSLEMSLPAVLGKFLAGNSHPQRAELMRGFMLEHVQAVSRIARDWLEGERVAHEIMGASEFATLRQAHLAMSEVATKSLDQVGTTARAQMSELVLNGRPLVHDLEDRLLILPNNQISGYRLNDLEQLNTNRVLVNLVLRGYAHDSGRAGPMPQITSAEAQEAFLDIKAIGHDLGYVDLRSLASGTRTFMEASIFQSVSDGDQYISLHEGVEWLSIVSSASKIADQLHGDLVKQCGANSLDVFGKKRLTVKCFRDHAIDELRLRFSHLPHVKRAINHAERNRELQVFLKTLEDASRPLGANDLPIETSELRVLAPILHYAESLFARFDANGTSFLERAEVWGVYPLVQPFIQIMSGATVLSEGELRAVYSWLLAYGSPPEMTITGKISFKAYQARMWLGLTDENASIQDVFSILASFNSVGRKKKNDDILNYYKENAVSWENGIAQSDLKIFRKTLELYQCSSEASALIAQLFIGHRSEFFTVNPQFDKKAQAADFLRKTKAAVQGDLQLQLLCGAF